MKRKARTSRPKKPKDLPLTERTFAALKRHGEGTTDAIARRVKERARAVGKALSALKGRALAHFTVRAGEAVWRKGAPRKRAARKR